MTMVPPPADASGAQPLEAHATVVQGKPDAERIALGAGHPHDTETPDIETASDGYAESRFGRRIGAWLLNRQTELIDRLLCATSGEPLRILEVGGGHGQVTGLLLERGHRVVVQGSDPVCFRRIETLLEQNPDRLACQVSALRPLSFGDGAFDMTIAVRLLGHVEHWRELLREMARVSSRYLMVEFARASPLLPSAVAGAAFSLKRTTEGDTRPFFCYEEAAIVDELRALGFRPVATGAQFALPMFLHRLVRSPAFSHCAESALRAIGVGDRFRSPVIVLAERARTRG